MPRIARDRGDCDFQDRDLGDDDLGDDDLGDDDLGDYDLGYDDLGYDDLGDYDLGSDPRRRSQLRATRRLSEIAANRAETRKTRKLENYRKHIYSFLGPYIDSYGGNKENKEQNKAGEEKAKK